MAPTSKPLQTPCSKPKSSPLKESYSNYQGPRRFSAGLKTAAFRVSVGLYGGGDIYIYIYIYIYLFIYLYIYFLVQSGFITFYHVSSSCRLNLSFFASTCLHLSVGAFHCLYVSPFACMPLSWLSCLSLCVHSLATSCSWSTATIGLPPSYWILSAV